MGDNSGKLQILVDSAYGMGHPGTFDFRPLVDQISNGVFEAGGKPAVFTVSDVCDGVAQGTAGMSYSLVSRDVMAAMIEIHALGQPHDGMVLLSGNDKSVPAHLIAIARCGLPAIHVPGGTCGACQLMGSASTGQVLAEALGIALPGSALVPAPLPMHLRYARTAGKRILELVGRGIVPRDIMTLEAFENALALHAAVGGSTNALIHVPAIARELGIEIAIDDFDRIQRRVPVLASVKATGKYPVEYFHYAGGVPRVMLEIRDLLHLDCLTVTGKTLGENLDALAASDFFDERLGYLRNHEIPPEEIIAPRSAPFAREGDLAVLRGNIAPEGALIRTFSVPREMHVHIGPARVFDREQDCLAALRRQEVRPGDVMVIRYEGPRGNGMPEMYLASAVLAADPVLGPTTALVTDGRFSGAMKGPCIGHVVPEAAAGGPIALLVNGDLIEINIAERKLGMVGFAGRRASDDEIGRVLAERRKHHHPSPPRHHTGILSLFGRVATSASDGACMTFVTKLSDHLAPATDGGSGRATVKATGSRGTVVILDSDFGDVEVERAIIEGGGFAVAGAQCKSEDEVIDAARDADAVLTQYAPVGARAIAAFRRCRVIARYGTGVDIVDVNAATRHGIQVTNARSDWCADEVADHAIALWLAAVRRLPRYVAATREGQWRWQSGAPIRRVRGSNFGVLSFGAIARRIADRARPFGVSLSAHDPFMDDEEISAHGVRPCSFEELVRGSDHLLIQAPLNAETRGLFDESVLRAMKPGAILVNTARGPIVSDRALHRALTEGWIAAAGLDDLEEEPAKQRRWKPSNPLLRLKNVVVTPHAAYYSEESIHLIREIAASEVMRVLAGGQPISPVNLVPSQPEMHH